MNKHKVIRISAIGIFVLMVSGILFSGSEVLMPNFGNHKSGSPKIWNTGNSKVLKCPISINYEYKVIGECNLKDGMEKLEHLADLEHECTINLQKSANDELIYIVDASAESNENKMEFFSFIK